MKKLIFFSFTLLILICTEYAKAGPCGWLCPGGTINWVESSFNPNVGNVNGCSFKINYKYGTCSSTGEHFIRILGIHFLNEYCDDVDEDLIMNYAIRAMLDISSGLFKIENPASGWDVRLITPMCWTKEEDDLDSCAQSFCCQTVYALRHRNDFIEATAQVGFYDEDNCNPTGGCTKICSAHEVEEDTNLVTYDPVYACLEDCPLVPFVYENDYVDYGGSGQSTWLRIYYNKRECDDVFEFFPRYIWIFKNDNSYSDSQLFTYALRKCLYEFAVDGLTDVIIRMPSCWKHSSDPDVLEVCNYTDCCVTEYTLTDNPSPWLSAVDRISDPGASCTSPCDDFCDVTNLTTGSLPKMADIEITKKSVKGFTYVVPNPTTGKLEIHFESSSTGLFSLKIFDSMGNILLTEEQSMGLNPAVWNIDASNYANGMYHYQIISNGSVILNGSFVVNK